MPASAVYGVRDGVVVVAALEPHFRQRLYAALDLPLDAPLADVMRMRTCAERTAVAATCDLPIVAVSATLCGPPAIAIVNTRD